MAQSTVTSSFLYKKIKALEITLIISMKSVIRPYKHWFFGRFLKKNF